MLPIPIIVGIAAGSALIARHIKKNGLSSEAQTLLKWLNEQFPDTEFTTFDEVINRLFENDRTPLMIACRTGNEAIVKAILRNGGYTDIRNSHGQTALFFAVKRGDTSIIKLLIKTGISINAMDNLGRTALFYAKDVECAKCLVDAGALIDASDNKGRTALFFALNEEIVNFLVEKKADVNVLDSDGRSPIYFALNGSVTHALLVNKANYNMTDNNGMTPYDFVRNLELRMQSGVETMSVEEFKENSEENFHQLTRWEFMQLVQTQNNRRLKERLEEWPEINVGVLRDEEDNPLLRSAIYSNNEEGAKLLIEHGANVNAIDGHGDPLIFSTILNNEAKMTRILCEAGAITNTRNAADKTALRVGFFYRNYEILELLVVYGADVSLRDENGRTPLFYAQKPSLINAIVKAGADVNAIDIYLKTPLFYAESAETVHALVANKAEVNFRDNESKTPVFSTNKLSLIRALLEEGALVDACPLNTAQYGEIILKEMFKYVSEQIEKHDMPKLKKLLSSDDIVFLVDSYGPLVLQTVKCKNFEAAKFLLLHGANPDCMDSFLETPLLVAIEKSYQDFVELLISYRAVVHVEKIDFDIYYYIQNNNNPLGVTLSYVECINNRVVIKKYADSARFSQTIRDQYDLRSRYQYEILSNYEKKVIGRAIQAGDDKILKILFQAGMSPNVDHVNRGYNAFETAVLTGNIALIDAFFDANVTDKLHRQTSNFALVNAIQKNDFPHFKRLFSNSVLDTFFLYNEAKIEDSLIRETIKSGNKDILEYLLKNYENLSKKFQENNTYDAMTDQTYAEIKKEAILYIREAIRCKKVEITRTLLATSPWAGKDVLIDIIDSDTPDIMTACCEISNKEVISSLKNDSKYIMRAITRGNVAMIQTIMDKANISSNIRVKNGIIEISLIEWSLSRASNDVCRYLIDSCDKTQFNWQELMDIAISPDIKAYIQKNYLQ